MPESSKILRYGVGIVHFGAQHRAIIDIHNPQTLYYTQIFWRSSFLSAFRALGYPQNYPQATSYTG